MNEYDIEDAVRTYLYARMTNRLRAAEHLAELAIWANSNSDGWAFWPKPRRAAKRLVELVERYPDSEEDCTEAELRKALVPVKAFLTRQGVAHETVLGAA